MMVMPLHVSRLPRSLAATFSPHRVPVPSTVFDSFLWIFHFHIENRRAREKDRPGAPGRSFIVGRGGKLHHACNTHGVVVIPEYECRWLRRVVHDAGKIYGRTALDVQIRCPNYFGWWLCRKKERRSECCWLKSVAISRKLLSKAAFYTHQQLSSFRLPPSERKRAHRGSNERKKLFAYFILFHFRTQSEYLNQ